MTIILTPMYFSYPNGIVISLSFIQSFILCLPLFFSPERLRIEIQYIHDKCCRTSIHPIRNCLNTTPYIHTMIHSHTCLSTPTPTPQFKKRNHPHTSAACYFSYSGAYKPSACLAPTKLAGQIPVTGHPAASTALGHREREGG
ncbi:hypothetical protein ASPFODRAFT_642677 [Aspergillus luchuensis CBS 106.47]|uniref:Uncharacterized protein n=1 Tax=Aspergillus luchuensis (strain CBS 106.47) TaxID=1137211 RepID=A0A1M3THI6_ASPLC|nr:hypothetical protein ASPFODRAFT_642677 [Aspergillus luchuensis CBS 106.47]